MTRTPVLIASAAISTLALAGCGSVAVSTAATPNPAASESFASAAASRASAEASESSAIAAAASSAASQPCTTHACIVHDAQDSLPGAVAADESVITKAKCYKSTVSHHAAAGDWTVECTAYYSDGTSVSGYANLLLEKDKITFQPTGT
jgi:hypothetical protein